MGKPDKRFQKLFATQQEHERRITEIAATVQKIWELLEEKRQEKRQEEKRQEDVDDTNLAIQLAVREMFK